jgi:hypothetical protein
MLILKLLWSNLLSSTWNLATRALVAKLFNLENKNPFF